MNENEEVQPGRPSGERSRDEVFRNPPRQVIAAILEGASRPIQHEDPRLGALWGAFFGILRYAAEVARVAAREP